VYVGTGRAQTIRTGLAERGGGEATARWLDRGLLAGVGAVWGCRKKAKPSKVTKNKIKIYIEHIIHRVYREQLAPMAVVVVEGWNGKKERRGPRLRVYVGRVRTLSGQYLWFRRERRRRRRRLVRHAHTHTRTHRPPPPPSRCTSAARRYRPPSADDDDDDDDDDDYDDYGDVDGGDYGGERRQCVIRPATTSARVSPAWL